MRNEPWRNRATARLASGTIHIYRVFRRPTITPAWQRRAARELLGVEPVELPGGHCPHVSQPEVLADLLEQIG